VKHADLGLFRVFKALIVSRKISHSVIKAFNSPTIFSLYSYRLATFKFQSSLFSVGPRCI